MKRKVLVIPKEELEMQFATNERQDVKIVAPAALTDKLFDVLKNIKGLKLEILLDADTWMHAPSEGQNLLCLSSEFVQGGASKADGSFTLSFATEKAEQAPHYHKQHTELYFSEHPIHATFRSLDEAEIHSVGLDNGGAIIFNPEIIHHVKLAGLTLVIEIPAVLNDKVVAEL